MAGRSNVVARRSARGLLLVLGSALTGCGNDPANPLVDTTPAATLAPPDGWYQMGYSERNTYHNPVERTLSPTNAATLELKWTFTVSGFPPGGPIIAEGRAFVLATGGLYAIDLVTGQQAWSRPDLRGTASVAYADGALYVHTGSADLYRVLASDGSTVWGPIRTHDNPVADGISSPIVAAGKVMVGHSAEAAEIDLTGQLAASQMAARGGVFAADIATGAMLWDYYTVPGLPDENGAMVWSSVGVDVGRGRVFATTSNSWNVAGPGSDAFHMIDLATGSLMWVQQIRQSDLWNIGLGVGQGLDTDFGANPIVAEYGGRATVAAGDKGSAFWALDAETGEILFSRDQLSSSHNEANGGVLNNGGFDGTYYYVVSNQPASDPSQSRSLLHALDPAQQGADAWPPKVFDKMTWGMPTTANGLLVVPVDDDLYVLDARTGEQLTMFSTGGSIAAGGAAIAQGSIVVASGLQYQIAGINFAKNNNQIHCYGLPGRGVTNGSKPAGSGGVAGAAGMTDTGNVAGASGIAGAGSMAGATTINAIFDEIFTGSGCNGQPACHATAAGGGLNLSSKELAYSSLVDVAAMGVGPTGAASCTDSGLLRVAAGDPESSLLIKKVEHTQTCGGPMPSADLMLPPTQLQQLRGWIAQGALDN